MMLDPNVDVNTKPLVCKICASQCKPQGASCCASNDFVRVCRYHYIAGTNNVQSLRDLIELTLGMDNFCEDHRYLYEYVIKIGNVETIGCKQCVVNMIGQPQNGIVTLKLLNQQFLDELSNERLKEIEQVFKKMDSKIKRNDLRQTLQKVDQAQQLIQPGQQMMQEEQPDEGLITKLEKLNQLKNAFEKKICTIADLKGGYHEYLHDEFLEDKSLRKTILKDNEEVVKGYDKKQIYDQLDNIQFI